MHVKINKGVLLAGLKKLSFAIQSMIHKTKNKKDKTEEAIRRLRN